MSGWTRPVRQRAQVHSPEATRRLGRYRLRVATLEKPGPAGQLVGRSAERQAIARALDEVGSGNPRVVWVEGDAGLGKTALVRHVVGHLPAEMQVAHAQGDELAAERPFELARQLGSTSAESFAAGLEILDIWAQRQDEGSVMVVVEDLHWADRASSKALLSAVQRLDKDRVAVLVTTRPGLHNGWERLRSDPERCLAINLAPFDTDEVELFRIFCGDRGDSLSSGAAPFPHRGTPVVPPNPSW